MSVVAAYLIFVCALFVVQGGMWIDYSQSTYLAIASPHTPPAHTNT